MKDPVRDARVGLALEALGRDLHHSLRQAWTHRSFTAAVVLIMATGIGASTAAFSVVDALFLRPPPFRHVDRLVHVFDLNSSQAEPDVDVDPSPANFLDWRERMQSFDRAAAWRNWYYTLAGARGAADAPESVRGVRVSPTFFEMLGVDMIAGRSFRNDEERPGNDRVVVLAHRLWKRRFNANPDVIGRTVSVDGVVYTVVGVLPESFQFLQPDLDVWMPLTIDESFQSRQNHSVMVVARLRPGVSLAAAQAELDAVCAHLADQFRATNAGWGARLVPLHPNHYLQYLRPGSWLLLGASIFVLLIACANAANLILARMISRRREFAIRAAIGASRSRLMGQAVTESAVLAGLGAVAGSVVAYVGLRYLLPLLPHPGPNLAAAGYRPFDSMPIDSRVLGSVVAFATITGIACGVIPATQAAKDGVLTVSTQRFQRAVTGRILIGIEIALSVVLLFGSALLLESLWALGNLSPGFRAERIVTAQMWLPNAQYPEPLETAEFLERVLTRVDAAPGVRAAGAVNFRPFLGMGTRTNIDPVGWSPNDPGDAHPLTAYRVVSPGYLAALGQPLSRGRDFSSGDGTSSEGVALINEALAKRFWPHEDPIGKHIRPAFHHTDVPWDLDATPRSLRIVGVVGNIREFRVTDPEYPEFYVCYLQFPSRFMYLMVRADDDTALAASAIRQAVMDVDPTQPIALPQTMDAAIARSMGQPRFDLVLLGVFAAAALLLSASGIYALTSYSVGQRTQEIAVRMALGAQSMTVCGLFARELLLLSGVSASIGVLLAMGLGRLMSSLLYGVSSGDPTVLTAVTGILLMVVVTAGLVPVRRAASMDPMIALRRD